jgi:hypothetical protein
LERKRNSTRRQLSSLTVSESLLSELCEILDEQYARRSGILRDESCYVRFEFKGDTYDIIRNSAPALLLHQTKGVTIVMLEFHCHQENIAIHINLKRNYLSEFRVTGSDPVWVNDTAADIDRVFSKYRTRNDLFHAHWKKAVPIYVGLSAIVCFFFDFLIYNTLQYNDPNRSLFVTYVVVFVSLIGPLMLGWHELFQWLYPKFQTESLRRTKFRIWVIIGIFVFLASTTLWTR